jgi:hypothetical protein
MTTPHKLTRTHAAGARTPGRTIHVAGGGLFMVTQGRREVLRGTFEQCYDYVHAALEGPREGQMC